MVSVAASPDWPRMRPAERRITIIKRDREREREREPIKSNDGAVSNGRGPAATGTPRVQSARVQSSRKFRPVSRRFAVVFFFLIRLPANGNWVYRV